MNNGPLSSAAENINRSARDILAQFKHEEIIPVESPQAPFANISEYIRAIFRLLELLASADLNDLPTNSLAQITQQIGELHAVLNNLRTFVQRHSHDGGQRDNLHKQCLSAHAALYSAAALPIAYGHRRGTDLVAIEAAARQRLSELRNLVEEARTLLQQTQVFSVDVAIEKQSLFFDVQATRHGRAAWGWLIAAAIFGAAVLVYLRFASASVDAKGLGTAAVFAVYLPRFLTVSVLLYGMALCAKNYRANQHNHIANQHRALSLKTFTVFAANAGGDQAVKNAVLLQAANTIFAPQVSGYSPDQADPLPHTTAIDLLGKIRS